MLDCSDIDIQNMISRAKNVRAHAYAPYSHFQVGVCILTSDGSYFDGCNCENASYGATLCAEASALGAMVSSGKREIQAIVVVGSTDEVCYPCGVCRQRIAEFATKDTMVISCSKDGKSHTVPFHELLPYAFTEF